MSDTSSTASLESTGLREGRLGRGRGECGAWVVPLMVVVGLGFLVYLLYCYSCHAKKTTENGNANSANNANNSGNGVVVKSPSQADKNGVVEKNEQASGKDAQANGKNANGVGKSVVDLEAERLVALQQKQPVIVAFVAENCGWCKKFKPNYIEAAKKLNVPGLDLHTLTVNSEKKMGVCKVFNVRGFPTLVCVFKDRVVSEYKGDRTPDSIIAWVNSLVSGQPQQ